MAMEIHIDPNVKPFYEVSFILCSLVFCSDCKCEVLFKSSHPQYSDGFYYDQAIAMQREGWKLLPVEYEVICAKCASKRDMQ
jgi:hypothetical protein